MQINKTFINSLLSFGTELSKEVVEIQANGFETLQKDDKSPLTEADLHSNKRIREFLFANTKVSNIISEEDKHINYEDRKDWDYYWLIDPIDGTKEFVAGGDDFALISLYAKGMNLFLVMLLAPKKKISITEFKGLVHLKMMTAYMQIILIISKKIRSM